MRCIISVEEVQLFIKRMEHVNMNGLSVEMQNFLLSGYFGDVTEGNIGKLCVNRAYQDVCRTIPYRYSLEKIKDRKNEPAIKKFVEKKKLFYAEIETILSEVKASDKPITLIETVKQKSGNYSEIFREDGFTYGQAQKWVNMTLKYLWLFGKCPIAEEELDVPLDSYIIHAIVDKKSKNKYGLHMAIDGLKADMPWSILNNMDLYNAIQQAVQREIEKTDFNTDIKIKIQWENLAWLEQVKITK